jgi:hypothetical protein
MSPWGSVSAQKMMLEISLSQRRSSPGFEYSWIKSFYRREELLKESSEFEQHCPVR